MSLDKIRTVVMDSEVPKSTSNHSSKGAELDDHEVLVYPSTAYWADCDKKESLAETAALRAKFESPGAT